MSRDEVKFVIQIPYKPLVLFALTYFVNLKDRELNVLVCRYMRGMTQEEAAEELNRSVNTIQLWEYSALDKCAKAWENNEFIQELIEQFS